MCLNISNTRGIRKVEIPCFIPNQKNFNDKMSITNCLFVCPYFFYTAFLIVRVFVKYIYKLFASHSHRALPNVLGIIFQLQFLHYHYHGNFTRKDVFVYSLKGISNSHWLQCQGPSQITNLLPVLGS